MKLFVKYRIWDWVLCVVISLGLVYHLYSGFELTEGFSGNTIIVLAVVCILQAVFFLFSYTKCTMKIGVGIGIACLVLFIVYAQSVNPFADETANSVCVTWVITIVAALLVYLATRSRPGIIALLIAGNFVVAGSVFLQFPVEVWCFFAFLVPTLVMMWMRTYMITLHHMTSGRIQLSKYLRQTVIGCLVAILLALGIFVSIIRPLQPPVRELKLITAFEQMDLLQVLGVSSVKHILDPSLTGNGDTTNHVTSNQADTIDENRTTSETGGTDDTSSDSDKKETDMDTINESEMTNQDQQEQTKEIHYHLQMQTIPWLILMIIIVIVALFVLRELARRRWKRQLDQMDAESAAVNYYRFFLKGLSKTGYRKPAHHTLQEYAANIEHEMQALNTGESTFTMLTQLYIHVIYGEKTLTQKEASLFEQFYQGFYKNLRKEMGVIKYFWKTLFLF